MMLCCGDLKLDRLNRAVEQDLIICETKLREKSINIFFLPKFVKGVSSLFSNDLAAKAYHFIKYSLLNSFLAAYKQQYSIGYSLSKKIVIISLLSGDHILLAGKFDILNDPSKEAIQKYGGVWDLSNKGWKCPRNQYVPLKLAVKIAKTFLIQDDKFDQLENTDLIIEGVPNFALEISNHIGDKLQFNEGKNKIEINYAISDANKQFEDFLPPDIVNNLYGFQKEGIRFGIANKGRVLIADEMGVGKTIQAICLASCYKDDWPLLVICPSSLKYNWKEEIMKWDPTLEEFAVQIIVHKSDYIFSGFRALICSYDLAPKILDKLSDFKIQAAIADEAHYLKNADAKRTIALLPYLKKLKRVILLSGTPAFARPKEIFTLLQIIRPDIFKAFKPFGERYCDPKPAKFGQGLDYAGSSNEKELHLILKKTLMIRRLKSEVLSQLPSKRRKKVLVNVDKSIMNQISDILNHTSKSSLEQLLETATAHGSQNQEAKQGEQPNFYSAFSQCYQLTGLAKIEELKNYIADLLENDIKLIIFAHHKEMMDLIEAYIKTDLKKKSIRIDGNVSSKDRHDRVQQFQNDQSVKVAVLSLSAACTGITLTASSNIVFAEMHWTPAIMLQAEDRAHRIGQENSVLCHYIVGQQTLDDILYKKIEKKIGIVSNILDGEKKNLRIDLIRNTSGQLILENEENFHCDNLLQISTNNQKERNVKISFEGEQEENLSLNSLQKDNKKKENNYQLSPICSDSSDTDDEFTIIAALEAQRRNQQELQACSQTINNHEQQGVFHSSSSNEKVKTLFNPTKRAQPIKHSTDSIANIQKLPPSTILPLKELPDNKTQIDMDKDVEFNCTPLPFNQTNTFNLFNYHKKDQIKAAVKHFQSPIQSQFCFENQSNNFNKIEDTKKIIEYAEEDIDEIPLSSILGCKKRTNSKAIKKSKDKSCNLLAKISEKSKFSSAKKYEIEAQREMIRDSQTQKEDLYHEKQVLQAPPNKKLHEKNILKDRFERKNNGIDKIPDGCKGENLLLSGIAKFQGERRELDQEMEEEKEEEQIMKPDNFSFDMNEFFEKTKFSPKIKAPRNSSSSRKPNQQLHSKFVNKHTFLEDSQQI